MEIIAVTDLSWADEAQARIDCIATFDALGTIPFTASADDTAPHSIELFVRAVAGEFGAIAPYVPPPPPIDPATIVPAFVHRRQLRTALHFAGLLATVEAFIDHPDTDISMKIAWADTTYFERLHPMITGMAASLLGMGELELDDFFRFAATMP